MTEVWLAQQSWAGPVEVLGVFETRPAAEKVCQDEANEYFGEALTPALKWAGDDAYGAAPYSHPVCGSYLFQVVRYEVGKRAGKS